MHNHLPRRHTLLALALFASGCVTDVGGTQISIDLFGMQPEAAPGATPQTDQAPDGTHYSLYFVQNGRDADDNDQVFWFEAVQLSVYKLIDLTEPCLMDDSPTRYPGIHITGIVPRLRVDVGFDTPEAAPDTASRDDIYQLDKELTRAANFDDIDNLMRVVAGPSTTARLAQDTVCAEDAGSDPNLVPPPQCSDDSSNERRLALCTALFDSSDYYVGNDRVLTKPLNGVYYGTVFGPDATSPAGNTVGAFMQTSIGIDALDSLVMTWQYDDVDEDGVPDYPATVADADKSPVGQLIMSGEAIKNYVRGATVVELAGPGGAASGRATIIDLRNDTTQF